MPLYARGGRRGDASYLHFPWHGEVRDGLLEYGFPVVVVVGEEGFVRLSDVGDVENRAVV
jgi:hypothetical protein